MSHIASAADHMDGIYRRQRFIYDATRRYYLLGRNRVIADLDVPEGGTVLEIGCGTARNLVLAARRYPSARLYGLDVSEEMLRTARGSVERAGLERRITMTAGDATDFDATALFGAERFDRIFISYVLSMVPSWREVVRAAASHVAPGGAIQIVDFGDFAQYPALMRRAQHAWLGRFSVRPIAAFESKITAHAAQLGLRATTARLFGGYAIQAKLERR
ncbi:MULTISPECIES: class I SAM-dependent methyltransferase [Rhodomicrobium]|uniref:class I SAM-dependent methyltransferase n=1 Tax=Rhodomicrobium TaxID=1068 RepID=UPI000B4BDA92|nr:MULTISPECIES: class I SAM-dependent methyltransferase [Rhodomicrobium]